MASPFAYEAVWLNFSPAGRLIGMHEPAQTVLYELDAVGNRTGEKRVSRGVVTALTVAAFAALSPAQASAPLARQHNAVISFDANGNRTGEGTRRYRWDIRDTLTQVSDGATTLGTYDYDAKLQRVKADTAGGRVEYVLDGKYVLRETGARSRRYHFGEGEALAVTGVGGTSSQDRWLLIDGLGSVSTEVDATAGVVTTRQFDAWGNYRNGTAPTANETRLGYTGHQYDVETGLTYARARYYDLKLGVFLSRDSFEGVLTEAPSLHRFSYSHGSPLKYRDPTGRVAGCLFGGAIGCLADFVQWNRALLTWGQDNSANRYVKGDMEFMAGFGSELARGAKGLYEAQKADVLGRNSDGSPLSVEQRASGGPLQQLARTIIDPSYAAQEMVRGLPKSFKRTGDNWGKGMSALVNGDYRRAGQLLPFAEFETVMLVEGGRSFAPKPSKVLKPTAAVVEEELGPGATRVGEVCEGGNCTGPKCFVAGTLVLSADGLKPIETVKPGDVVFSRSDKTGESGWKRVLQTFETKNRAVLELRLVSEDGREQLLTTTPTHPFYIEGRGWLSAGQLKHGMRVPTAAGGWLRVASATWLQGGRTTFNFEVEDWHTYFVGELSVWVHNSGPKCPEADSLINSPADLPDEELVVPERGRHPADVTPDDIRRTPAFNQAKKQLKKNPQLCEYCQARPATDLDHSVVTASEAAEKVNAGKLTFAQADELANKREKLIPVCGSSTGPGNCNSDKGAKPLSSVAAPGTYAPPNPTERVIELMKKENL